MWWSNFLIACLLVVLLGACGFRPLYGTTNQAGGEPTTELAAITISPIPDRSGQELRASLEALLDPGHQRVPSLYNLAVELREEASESAIERSGFATRADLRIVAHFTLVESETGRVVLQSSTRAISSYNILSPSPFADYSTYTAATAARSRLIEQLAYEIRQRLGVYFSSQSATVAKTG